MKIFTALLMLLSLSVFALEDSPFQSVNYSKFPSVIVEVENKEYYLLGINGTHRKVIMKACQEMLEDACQNEFKDNFLETMEDLGLKVENRTVELRLYDISTHSIKKINVTF